MAGLGQRHRPAQRRQRLGIAALQVQQQSLQDEALDGAEDVAVLLGDREQTPQPRRTRRQVILVALQQQEGDGAEGAELVADGQPQGSLTRWRQEAPSQARSGHGPAGQSGQAGA